MTTWNGNCNDLTMKQCDFQSFFVSRARIAHSTFYSSVNLRVDWQASRHTKRFVRHLPGILMSLMAFSFFCWLLCWERARERFPSLCDVDERNVFGLAIFCDTFRRRNPSPSSYCFPCFSFWVKNFSPTWISNAIIMKTTHDEN